MKILTNRIMQVTFISLFAVSLNINASEQKPHVYLNENIGFNVEGYKYKQAALPCEVDVNLAKLVLKKANKSGLNMEGVTSAKKVRNGTIPVLLIDIEQLSLRQGETYGKSKNFNLPKIQVTAAVLKGTDLQTAKHTCAMTSKDNFTMPTDNITLNSPASTQTCAIAKKCLKDLSKDIVEWLKPQVK